MTPTEAEAKVLDIIEKAVPDKLTEEQIRGHWHEVNVPSAEKKRLIEEAVIRLFDKGKIQREYVPAKTFCYFK